MKIKILVLALLISTFSEPILADINISLRPGNDYVVKNRTSDLDLLRVKELGGVIISKRTEAEILALTINRYPRSYTYLQHG
jgi:hypothetical protein